VKDALLREFLVNHFDDSELRTLCFDLGVDYDELRGESKADKARELIAYFERRGQMHYLTGTCVMLRPDVWGRQSRQRRGRTGITDRLSPHALDNGGREYRELILSLIDKLDTRVNRVTLIQAALLAMTVMNTVFLVAMLLGR
jgi:hypothetical protein